MTGGARLVMVSNRLPSLASRSGEGGQPAGGLVSALWPALEERSGLWLGWSGRTVARPRTLGLRARRHGPTAFVPMDLTELEVEQYYLGFCNRTLWPLLHCFPGRMRIAAADWQAYRSVNRRFAAGLSRLLRPGDVVWVHDYHLMPLGAELRRSGFRGRLGFFLHVPFPPTDLFLILPWAQELLEAMAAYDRVGFHTERYAHNFLEAFRFIVGGEVEGSALRVGGRATAVGIHPIGSDPERFRAWALSPEASRHRAALRRVDPDRKIAVAVDRLDYTKGIPQRLQALAALLERYPQWRRRVRLLQISAPSRTRVPEYVQQKREVEQLVGEINGRYSESDWAPVRYLYRSVAQEELAAIYREADLCLVTPLRDGMNLVAKEYVSCQAEEDPGVLVLSRFAGAAEELADAVIVNPYDVEGTADGIARALEMTRSERRRRWESLWARCRESTAKSWRDRFLAELEATPATG